ncbi:MAG: hypothetical protein FJ146_16930 [Deltaproteobacteria bacterium]|nr:hypothetical protein [Deltaproteobacteria bacterium]
MHKAHNAGLNDLKSWRRIQCAKCSILTTLLAGVVNTTSCNSSNFASGSAPAEAGGKEKTLAVSKSGESRITGAAANASSFSTVSSAGKLAVIVVDATSNEPIEGALVAVDGAASGTKTDSEGHAAIAYEAGNSHVTVTAKNYTEDSRQLVAETATLIVHLSPPLKSDQARIILSWNATPKDLDGHLYIQPKRGSDEHIYYINKKSPQANMDYDSKAGFGPETMTITKLVPGSYTYRVSDFTNCSAMNVQMSREALSGQSGARVRFLVGSDHRDIDVPPGQSGRVWSVLTFDVDDKLNVKLRIENLFADNCENYKY